MVNCACVTCGIKVVRKPSRAGFKQIFCSFACRRSFNYPGHISTEGYRIHRVAGKQVKEHRLVVEAHLGRRLDRKEIVHHVDGNPLNNNISNLRVMKQSEHFAEHRPLRWDIEAAKTMLAQGQSVRQIERTLDIKHGGLRHAFARRGITLDSLRRVSLSGTVGATLNDADAELQARKCARKEGR